MITLTHYLLLAAALFCIGLFGALSKRNALSVLMGIELMLNAVNINLVAFNHFLKPDVLTGHTFVVFVIVVAAAEVTVGLALILSLYRNYKAITVDDINQLKW
jgi:NADH:ubiquinone oxidoreductase subunit K